MTTLIESLDGGVIEAGFWGPDTSRVRFGDIAPMTTQQFVTYAGRVLIEAVIPSLDDATRRNWGQDMADLQHHLTTLPDKTISGKYFAQDTNSLINELETVGAEDQDELMSVLAADVVPVDEATYYEQNPFVVQADGTRVGVIQAATTHVVSSEDFFSLTYNIIRGGFIGWGSDGAYPEVKQTALLLDTALNT